MSSVMNPELQAIQKKYKNKRDQAFHADAAEEMQQVYDKIWNSNDRRMSSFINTDAFLFALYPVIYDIQTYVPAIKNAPDACK